MSIHDETWNRPICSTCKEEVAHGEKHLHGWNKCGKITLSCLSNILTNLSVLKDCGILTNERINEITQYCNKNNFQTTVLQDGRKLNGWLTHEPSGRVFGQQLVNTDSYYWLCNEILNDYLSQEEIKVINEQAGSVYHQKKDKEKFDKAEKIPAAEWYGPVYLEGTGWHEDYSSSVDDFLDWLADDNENNETEQWHPYVWACDSFPTCHLDLDDIINNATEEAHENFEIHQLKGVEELREAIDKFNELNKEEVSWMPNFHKVIIL